MAERLKSPLCVRLTTLSWCCIVGACGDDGTAGTDAQTTITATGDTTAESTTGSSTAPITTGTPTTGTSSTGTVTTDLSTTDPTTGDTITTGNTADTSTSDTSTGPVETCMDAAQNQDETDIDCGGASCPACVLGQMCLVNLDCAEGACVGNLCTMIECLADADCDAQDGECLDATCDLNDFTCVTGPINEAGPCDDADLCSLTSLCAAGACVADELVDCSGLDSACATGACNPDDGACVAVPAKDGDACDDDNGCTADTVCTAGVCGDVNSPGYLLYEDFADNDAGWMMSQNWAIGPAVAGCGDPGTDHTATMDNGVAGVVIGGCAPTLPMDANFILPHQPGGRQNRAPGGHRQLLARPVQRLRAVHEEQDRGLERQRLGHHLRDLRRTRAQRRHVDRIHVRHHRPLERGPAGPVVLQHRRWSHTEGQLERRRHPPRRDRLSAVTRAPAPIRALHAL